MNKDAVMRKIKSCLRMAQDAGASPGEAATALRQAQKLMQAHGVTELDMAAAEVREAFAKASANERPSLWESALANVCGKTFGCELLFQGRFDGKQLKFVGYWDFIGVGAAPEIARYGFEVLLRQCKKARQDYIKTTLRRCGQANKTRRADLYCCGWVAAATARLPALQRTAEQEQAMQTWLQQNAPDIEILKSTDRNAKSGHRGIDGGLGYLAGKDAQLNQGIGQAPGAERRRLR